jgi:hypothetical protein
MTEFTRDVRRTVDKVARERGRPLELAVSAHGSFSDCMAVGLDVPTWLREGLLDILISGWPPFNPCLQEARAATREAGCRMYSRFIWNPAIFTSQEVVSAAALLHWRQGVDGLYVFNFNHRPERMATLRDIGDPEVLASASKHYVLDKNPDLRSDMAHHTVRPSAPRAWLPVTLEADPGGPGQCVRFELADDVESAANEGTLGEARLQLKLKDYSPEVDELHLSLNGTTLLIEECETTRSGGMQWLSFRLAGPPLRQGENTLHLGLRRRNPYVRNPLVLTCVEVLVNYKSYTHDKED